MMREELSGAINCETGSGRLGEMLQHADMAEPALILLDAVSNIFSIIAAIFGQ